MVHIALQERRLKKVEDTINIRNDTTIALELEGNEAAALEDERDRKKRSAKAEEMLLHRLLAINHLRAWLLLKNEGEGSEHRKELYVRSKEHLSMTINPEKMVLMDQKMLGLELFLTRKIDYRGSNIDIEVMNRVKENNSRTPFT